MKSNVAITSIEDDPFANLDNLRLSQNFVETCGVKKLLMTIPVRKPNAQDFIRVHSDPAYRESFPVIDLKGERELYIVTRDMQAELSTECVPATLSPQSIAKVSFFSGRCASLARTERPIRGGGRPLKPWRWG